MARKSNTPHGVFKHIDMKEGDTDACWEWKGKVNTKDGRPYYTVEGSRRPAYRYVLELYTGEEQPKTVLVLHQCDNPICCNPHHLTWGTHQQNMNEMKERDRHGLPKTVVRAIRKLLDQGRTHREVADLYGVSRETITAINNDKVHKDVGGC
jgi:DNA-binding XRE family transcriptional regulator